LNDSVKCLNDEMMLRDLVARTLVVASALAAAQGCGSSDSAEVNTKKSCPKVVTNGGGGIAMPNDGSQAPECGSSVCNYQSQQGCSAEETCTPVVSDGTNAIEPLCVPAGDNARGAACSNLTPCKPGDVCAAGYCRKLCCAGDWTVCDAGESCFRSFSYQIGNTATPTGAWLCYPVGECSVLDPHPAACKDGEDCKLVDSQGSEACVPKSPGAIGEDCGRGTGRLCGAGLTCVGQPGAEACRRLCRAEECGEPACPVEEGTCVHFDRDPPGVGECTPGW